MDIATERRTVEPNFSKVIVKIFNGNGCAAARPAETDCTAGSGSAPSQISRSYPPDGLGIVGIDGIPEPGGIFMSFIIAAQQSIDWAAGGSAFIIEGQQLCREKSR